MMTRRHAFGAVLLFASISVHAADTTVHVYKTSTCGCCGKWVEHMRANGFKVEVTDVEDTAEYRRKFGVPEQLQSCHTATVGGYALEGHVPAADVQRLLKTRPKAKGLAAPGMPMGSPGMENGTSRQAYSVVLFDEAGVNSVFSRDPAKESGRPSQCLRSMFEIQRLFSGDFSF